MAILHLVPGLFVSIQVDGEDVHEYDDDEEVEVQQGDLAEHRAVRTVSKYIESISEKEFSVQLHFENPYVMDCAALIWRITIDGKLLDSPVTMKSILGDHFEGNRLVKSYTRISQGVLVDVPGTVDKVAVQKYRFAKIETNWPLKKPSVAVDDMELKSFGIDAASMAKIGEIVVEVHRGFQPVKSDSVSTMMTKQNWKVHEKALKGQAKSHSTQLGPATGLLNKAYVQTTEIDGKDRPQAIFRFKYRSREALRSLLIIERTPTPEPEQIDLHNLDPLRREQVESFLRSLDTKSTKTLRPFGPAIKREVDSDDYAGPKKKSKLNEKLTIDLTESDDEDHDSVQEVVS